MSAGHVLLKTVFTYVKLKTLKTYNLIHALVKCVTFGLWSPHILCVYNYVSLRYIGQVDATLYKTLMSHSYFFVFSLALVCVISSY